MSNNPFLTLNSRLFSDEEFDRIRTERKPEFEMLRDCVTGDVHNTAISGNFGTGKSFILRDVLNASTLTKTHDVVDLKSLQVIPDGLSDYLSHFLRQYCMHIWTDRFDRSASDLLRLSSRDFSSIWDDLKGHQKKFARIYQYLSAEQFDTDTKRSSAIGTTKFIKSETGTNHAIGTRRKDLDPFECLALLEEIHSYGGSKPVIFVWDEVNHMGRETQRQLLNEFFPLFSKDDFRYLAVFSEFYSEDGQFDSELFGAFRHRVPLSGMRNPKDLVEFVGKYTANSDYSVTRAAVDVLYEHTLGVPRNSLEILAGAADQKSSGGSISPKDIARSWHSIVEKENSKRDSMREFFRQLDDPS